MKRIISGLSVLAAISTSVFGQGSLTPPGPPGPMMKTLQQIEPRTPISVLPFTISAPGGYYITTNLTGIAGANGITILTDNVDLNLAGFTLTGTPGSLSGVWVPNSRINITLHNGRVCSWPGYGVNATNATSAELEQLSASSNGSGGLAVGGVSIIGHCQSRSNVGTGIVAGVGLVIADCVSTLNQGWGISVGDNTTIRSCASIGNNAGGITVGNGCAVTDCTANGNNTGGGVGISTGSDCNILRCTADYNAFSPVGPAGAYGISVGNSCHIKDCTANGNAVGIGGGANSYVQDCVTCSNQNGSSGNGINVGDFSSVRGCVAQGNSWSGIALGNYCSAFDNTCTADGNNGFGNIGLGSHSAAVHNFVSSNYFPGIIALGTNNVIGTLDVFTSANTNKNPHANFSQ